MTAAEPRQHPGDLLSAHADGELVGAEHEAVESHLAGCPACRDELAATRQTKAWVAGLPEVMAPFGFLERMLLDPSGPRGRRDRWALKAGAVSLAATASIWLAVFGLSGLTGNRPGGLPALNSLVSLHEEAPPVVGAATQGAPERAAALGLPAEMGRYELSSVVDAGEPQQVTYLSGDETLSVFVYVGYEIQFRRLPAGTREHLVEGGRAWIVPAEPAPVIFAQVGANAMVLVGPDPAAPSMADRLEPRDAEPSLMDRVQGAGEGLLEAFGLG